MKTSENQKKVILQSNVGTGKAGKVSRMLVSIERESRSAGQKAAHEMRKYSVTPTIYPYNYKEFLQGMEDYYRSAMIPSEVLSLSRSKDIMEEIARQKDESPAEYEIRNKEVQRLNVRKLEAIDRGEDPDYLPRPSFDPESERGKLVSSTNFSIQALVAGELFKPFDSTLSPTEKEIVKKHSYQMGRKALDEYIEKGTPIDTKDYDGEEFSKGFTSRATELKFSGNVTMTHCTGEFRDSMHLVYQEERAKRVLAEALATGLYTEDEYPSLASKLQLSSDEIIAVEKRSFVEGEIEFRKNKLEIVPPNTGIWLPEHFYKGFNYASQVGQGFHTPEPVREVADSRSIKEIHENYMKVHEFITSEGTPTSSERIPKKPLSDSIRVGMGANMVQIEPFTGDQLIAITDRSYQAGIDEYHKVKDHGFSPTIGIWEANTFIRGYNEEARFHEGEETNNQITDYDNSETPEEQFLSYKRILKFIEEESGISTGTVFKQTSQTDFGILKRHSSHILKNCPNVSRFSGEHLMVKEDLAHHQSDMGCSMLILLIEVPDLITVDKLSPQDLVYRAVIHDLYEAASQDVARKLKYYTKELAEAINAASKAIATPELKPWLIADIDNAKGLHDKPGTLVKFMDIYVAIIKCYQEVFLLNNNMMIHVMLESLNNMFDLLDRSSKHYILGDFCDQFKDFGEELRNELRVVRGILVERAKLIP